MIIKDAVKKVLITGGSGYFGSVLRDALLAKKELVRIFDILDADDRPSSVEFVKGDIRNLEHLRRACDQISVVYHCVAQVPIAKNKSLFQSVNVTGTENLLQVANEKRVGKIVFLSSSAVYGIPLSNPVSEDSVPRPLEDYGRSKLAGEELVRRHAKEGLDVSIVRPRTILGHGRLGIFQLLFEWISEGRNVYLLGTGDNRYQFVHAEDLADACIRAAERPGPSEYNVGADRYCSMRESLEGLIAHAKSKSRLISLPMGSAAFVMRVLSWSGLLPFAPYHWLMYGRDLFFDCRRAKEELDWRPKWGNVEMLCESYDWYLSHRNRDYRKELSAHRSPLKQGLLRLLKWIS